MLGHISVSKITNAFGDTLFRNIFTNKEKSQGA
jgi:hypothetical protein